MKRERSQEGKVYIVGAGPGAPDLITVKGLRALRLADAIFFDALVNRDLLLEAGENAEKIFVGKRCGRHEMDQKEINRRIVAEAMAGKSVVRLKGGDPLLFGRGGEEALACEEAGVEFEIVPGVSSAMGAAGYAGIPLTHRGIASSVAFVTAHEERSQENSRSSLARVAQSVDTLVIFMGGTRLPSIAKQLIDAGRSRLTPVAIISQATTPKQHTIRGSLESIADQAAQGMETPVLIIVGEVTNLSAALNWYERQRAVLLQENPPMPCV